MKDDKIFAVTIWDRTADGRFLSFDLSDILQLCGERARLSTWLCLGVDAIGAAAEQIHALSEREEPVEGRRLLEIAENIDQTFEGDFEARLAPSDEPWLVIRAVRSMEFVVATTDTDVIEEIRERFTDVRDSPLDADYLHHRTS